jgi:predicted dehydrogenase
MDKIRYSVIGTGGMGSAHLQSLSDIEEAEITAICDMDLDVCKEKSETFDVPGFLDYKELLKSDLVDAVTIATPHYFHSPIAVDAMEGGLHVLSEKPLAVTVAAADAMVEAAKASGVTFAVMYQRRSEPMMQAVHGVISAGGLGTMYRTAWVEPNFRTQAYYDSATWRGTWNGEGGGVLLNQAPHGIDLFTWFGGLPSKVTATTRTWRHRISVEDEASALLEYPDGGIGYYFTSTNEAPAPNFFEFSGESGKLRVDSFGLHCWSLEKTMQDYSDDAEDMWGSPTVSDVDVEITERESGHTAILRNMTANILHGEPLISPGVDGLAAVEFINAVILSGGTGETVTTPVDRDAYESFMNEKRRTETPKAVARTTVRKTDPRL